MKTIQNADFFARKPTSASLVKRHRKQLKVKFFLIYGKIMKINGTEMLSQVCLLFFPHGLSGGDPSLPSIGQRLTLPMYKRPRLLRSQSERRWIVSHQGKINAASRGRSAL